MPFNSNNLPVAIAGDVAGVISSDGKSFTVSGTGTGTVPKQYKVAVAFNTASIKTGATLLAIPAGAIVKSVTMVVTTLFDGTTPKLNVASTAAHAVSGATASVFTASTAAVSWGGNALAGVTISTPIYFTAAGSLFVALTDGSGGDPASTAGAATFIFEVSVPA